MQGDPRKGNTDSREIQSNSGKGLHLALTLEILSKIPNGDRIQANCVENMTLTVLWVVLQED